MPLLGHYLWGLAFLYSVYCFKFSPLAKCPSSCALTSSSALEKSSQNNKATSLSNTALGFHKETITSHDVCSKRLSKGSTKSRSESKLNSLDILTSYRGGFIGYDAVISSVVVAESLIWLKLWTTVAKKGWLRSTLTRKIIHSGSAPLFLLHWPLYSLTPTAAATAAFVPFLQISRLYLAGKSSGNSTLSGSSPPSELVAAVSRSGQSKEALGGPLIYSCILFLGTLLFFRSSSVAVVGISQMAMGDGLADIVGRRYGTVKWPMAFAKDKSAQGSLAFVAGGFLCSAILLYWLQFTGFLAFDISSKLPQLLAISILSAVVELLPGVDDNISVPIVAGLAAYLLLDI